MEEKRQAPPSKETVITDERITEQKWDRDERAIALTDKKYHS